MFIKNKCDFATRFKKEIQYYYIIWEEIQFIHRIAAHKCVTPYREFTDTTRTRHKNDNVENLRPPLEHNKNYSPT